MVKKKILLSVAFGVLAVGSLACLGNSYRGFSRVSASPNTIEFNATTNNFASIGNGMVAYTYLNNPIAVGVSGLEDLTAYEDGAFTIAPTGYVENVDPITGITSVVVNTANSEDVVCKLGYLNDGNCLWVEDVVLGDESTFDFNNTQPDFLRFTNANAEPVSIVSIKIDFACSAQSNIWEVKGSFNSWGDGLKMYYNYSYEYIETTDQWMLKGVSFDKNAQFKFHNPAESIWVGVQNAEISDSEGSAKKAGQISGTDNIMVKTAITTDLYLKITRGATPSYSIWIKEDPNAEPVEQVTAYEFQVVGNTSQTGNWSMGNGFKFVLNEEKSTASSLHYETTITFAANDLFKICCIESGQWIGHNWGRHASTSNITNDGENFKVVTAGTYLIELKNVSPTFGETGCWDLEIEFTLK